MSARSSARGASVAVVNDAFQVDGVVAAPPRSHRPDVHARAREFRKQPGAANHDIRVTRCTYRDVSPQGRKRAPNATLQRGSQDARLSGPDDIARCGELETRGRAPGPL